MQTEGTMDHQQQQPEDVARTDVVRVSWPVAAAALLGLLALVLVGAFVLNRQFRAPVGVTPTTPATVAGEQVQPTALPVAATAVATAAPTPAPTATVAPAPAAAAASPSSVPTVDPGVAREIGAAYERYWAVRAGSLLSLDTSHLAEVMAGDELAAAQRYIERLRNEGRAIKTDVTLHYTVVQASATEAQVYDEYTSSSVFVDPNTKQPLEQAPAPDTLKVTHFMQKIDGTWRVTGEFQHP